MFTYLGGVDPPQISTRSRGSCGRDTEALTHILLTIKAYKSMDDVVADCWNCALALCDRSSTNTNCMPKGSNIMR